MTWEKDKCWSDKFMPEVQRILGRHFILPAPIEEDQERNTDLQVLKLKDVRIAVRIRKEEYLKLYPDEITIRSARPSGKSTELDKILSGWGDYFFYGFGSDSGELLAWALCDLYVFRDWFTKLLRNKEHPGKQCSNSDNSGKFHAFSFSCMPEKIVIERFFARSPW